jgi:hypothetical protein
MRRRTAGPRRLLAITALTVGVGSACAQRGGTAGAVQEAAGPIRFAIEVGPEVTGPVYVSVSGSDGGPGWIRAFREGARVYLSERCEIADCGVPPAVCGAGIPLVRDLTAGGDRRVELVWDGLTSTVDSVAGCETRRPAPPGSYVARFCYSREADVRSPATPPPMGTAAATPGRLIRPTCEERPFTLADREAVLRL